MRSFLSTPKRRPKARERFKSKFKGGPTQKGNRDLHRFRRNREIAARERTTGLLWITIGLMLIPLGRTLWRVAQAHLADRMLLIQLCLPGAAVLALVFAFLRARSALAEYRDIRREQGEIMDRLQRALDPHEDT